MRLHHIDHVMDGGLGVDNRHLPNARSPQGFGTPFPAAGEASACIRGAELGGRDERGWVIQSQSWQLFECRDKLLHPEPVHVVVGGGEGWTLPEVLHPCKGLSRVFKRRLQKSFWFVDICCSSLKENNPSPLFFSSPSLGYFKTFFFHEDLIQREKIPHFIKESPAGCQPLHQTQNKPGKYCQK